jgi:hypothetical protein
MSCVRVCVKPAAQADVHVQGLVCVANVLLMCCLYVAYVLPKCC